MQNTGRRKERTLASEPSIGTDGRFGERCVLQRGERAATHMYLPCTPCTYATSTRTSPGTRTRPSSWPSQQGPGRGRRAVEGRRAETGTMRLVTTSFRCRECLFGASSPPRSADITGLGAWWQSRGLRRRAQRGACPRVPRAGRYSNERWDPAASLRVARANCTKV